MATDFTCSGIGHAIRGHWRLKTVISSHHVTEPKEDNAVDGTTEKVSGGSSGEEAADDKQESKVDEEISFK